MTSEGSEEMFEVDLMGGRAKHAQTGSEDPHRLPIITRWKSDGWLVVQIFRLKMSDSDNTI